MTATTCLLAGMCWLCCLPCAAAEPQGDPSLVAHWPLVDDARDALGDSHGMPSNVAFIPGGDAQRGGAQFNGRDSLIEIPDSDRLDVGARDFSIAAWIKCEAPMRSTFGDILSKFDPAARRGINLHVAGSSPAYSGMCDARHVHFGIDDGYLSDWTDCGRPWPSNSLVPCMVVFEGEFYCGIADAQRPEDRAHVFRYAGGQAWTDCGRLGDDPDHHSVMALLIHDGRLYAGTGIWDWIQARGRLKGSPPASPTRVFVYEGGTSWKDLGQVGYGSRVLTLASFGGHLYAGVDSVGDGHVYRLDGEEWVDCGAPDQRNLECLVARGGVLYAATHGNIYEFEGGQSWKPIGLEPYDIKQIHSTEIYQGRLHLGTWPQGYALRYEGEQNWVSTGRLGLPPGSDPECNEINDLIVYNGKLYAGVIPRAECYRYESDGNWTLLKQLAHRPDWKVTEFPTWNRLTCLTMFGGRLYAGTGACQGRSLDAAVDPSLGRVYSIQAGQVASHEHDIGGDWTHVAAVRSGEQLQLYMNGTLTASSARSGEQPFDLSNDVPLSIGFGAQQHFTGLIADVRLYQGALDPAAVQALASGP